MARSRTSASSVLAQFPGPVTLRPSKTKLLVPHLLGAVGILPGVKFFVDSAHGGGSILLAYTSLAMVCLAVVLGLVYFRPSNRITLRLDGFEVIRGRDRRMFRWRDVGNFRVEGVTVCFDNAFADENASPRLRFGNLFALGYDTWLPPYFGLSEADMAFLMKAWRLNALGRSHPALSGSRFDAGRVAANR